MCGPPGRAEQTPVDDMARLEKKFDDGDADAAWLENVMKKQLQVEAKAEQWRRKKRADTVLTGGGPIPCSKFMRRKSLDCFITACLHG